MLKLNHLSISFHNKNIFNNTDFIAADGKMTVIIGGSGTGKSTLLKTLLFEHKCDYYYNDKYLTGLNSDEKRVFIFQKISYIDQIPQFINDFTIGQHIELIKKIYSVIDDRKDYLKKLGIEDLLEKYPKQLSGGQKTRVAIFLGLIKEPEILILDEPTSSLDKDNILKVIEILTDYCQLGHTVIVSSHDNQLIKQCDGVYEIFNQRLNIINKNIESIIKYNDKKNLIFKKDGYYKYWKLLDSRHKYYNIVMTFLLSTTILITIFSNNFSNGANSSYKNQLNSLSSREMIVYKECVEGAGYSFNEDEFSFSKDEVNKIKQINHIKNMERQYNIILNTDTMSAYNTGENIERSENLMDVTLYEGDDIIESKNLNDCSVHFRTFKQSIDKKNLKYEFSDEGIIISNELYKKIFNNENLTHPYLEFIILIPQYNATNIAEYHLGDDVESQFTVPINTILGEYKKVKLPIAAVVNDDALINGVPIPEYAIYMNKVQLESYIKDSYSQEGRILYEVETNDGEYLLFYNDIPKNISIKKVSSTITESPWQPNSYVIEVDDLTNLNQVAKEISDLGYGVEGEYVDSTPFDLLSKQNQNVLTLSIASIFILLYVFYIYLKYLTMSNELGLRNFLEKLGLKDSEIKVLNTQRYMYKVLKLFLLTSVMFVAIIEFCVYNQIIFFIMKPEIKLFIYILFVAIIIEFIIPKFLEKISAFKQKK